MERIRYGAYFAAQGWYPAQQGRCLAMIREFEESWGPTPEPPPGGFLGGVVPHAGWVFSGRLAFRVFQVLGSSWAHEEVRVVLFGGHLGPKSDGWVLMSGVWPTPLGELETDEEFAAALAEAGSGLLHPVGPLGYEPDNTIELQLPLVKYCLPSAKVVASGIPASQHGLDLGRKAAELASQFSGTTLFVGSTDLTHYGPNYGFAPVGYGPSALEWVKKENDALSVERIEALDPEGLLETARSRHNACCPGAAGAALAAGRAVGRRRAEILGYATSADIHPGSSFVGYVAAAF